MSIINEEWRSISGYINYQVSNLGRIRSCKNGRILSPYSDKKGYLMIKLISEEGRKENKVHRLVAKEFVENPLDKPCVDHIDRNKKNNCILNLRWSTNQENIMNKSKQSSATTSKYKGVTFKSDRRKWVAQIKHNRSHIHLGCYDKEKDAARAYNERATELFGEYSCLNDISSDEEN